MNNTINVKHSVENDSLIITITGNVSAVTASILQSEIDKLINSEDLQQKNIILDAHGIEYISSAGLRVILQVSKIVSENKQTLSICSLSNNVKKIFETSGFNNIISIYEDKDSALAAQ